MKITPLPLICFAMIFASSCHSRATAQSPQQQKNDSVCQLIKKYFNAKSIDGLYQLTGPVFKEQISPEKFKSISENNLFPLGEIKETVFEKIVNGVSFYKATFPSMPLFLLVGVDSLGKLQSFAFQPYRDERPKKNYQVSFSNPLATALDKEVDTVAGSYIKLLNAIGLSVGILKDGKTHFYGYGETAKGDKIIPDSATLFEIGSISKTFTATLLALAVGDGKVRLDDPVNKYLPDSIPLLQYNNRVMTLRDLSNHTSAIPRMPSNFQATVVDPKDPYINYTVAQLYSFLRHLQLTREPGKQYEYSNAAVGLLGTILQNIYHGSYEELILKYICDPLGMHDTRVFIRKSDSSFFAKGYDDNGGYNGPWNLSPAFAGAGSIRSTARDLLKYADANAGKATGSLGKAMQLTHDTTFSDSQVTIGLGWHYFQAGDKKVLFHGGGTGGYRTFLAIDAQKRMAVVVLSNCTIDPQGEGVALMKWVENN